jgi:hypothetical protein
VKLALVQPSLRREWQLRRDDEVLATLQIPLFRRGAAAEVAGDRLTIERRGGLRPEYLVRDTTTGEQRALLRHRRLELGARSAEWKRLSWRGGYGFVGPDGEPFLHAKVSSGIARTNGEVEVDDDVAEPDALVAALLASFLLIRRAEDAASAAGSSAAVTTST